MYVRTYSVDDWRGKSKSDAGDADGDGDADVDNSGDPSYSRGYGSAGVSRSTRINDKVGAFIIVSISNHGIRKLLLYSVLVISRECYWYLKKV